jgi:hypothetical protein
MVKGLEALNKNTEKNEKQNGLYCWFRLCRFTVS